MADLTLTAAQVAVINPHDSEIIDYIAGAAVTAGQALYVDANGRVQPCSASGSSPVNRFRGIALNPAGAGQAVSVLKQGPVGGFNLSGLAYDAAVYASNSAGALADAAGTTSLVAGRVMAMTDPAGTKVLYITGWAG